MNGWTPVERGLPNIAPYFCRRFIVTRDVGGCLTMEFVDWWDVGNGMSRGWADEWGNRLDDVIAWCDAPEPYRREAKL